MQLEAQVNIFSILEVVFKSDQIVVLGQLINLNDPSLLIDLHLRQVLLGNNFDCNLFHGQLVLAFHNNGPRFPPAKYRSEVGWRKHSFLSIIAWLQLIFKIISKRTNSGYSCLLLKFHR